MTDKPPLRNLDVGETGCVNSHFLDSGSFSLWSRSIKYAEENKTDQWAFYRTNEFRDYLDCYAKFVQKYKIAIDYYANVDVIPNPELTWKSQRYLEKKYGLDPVPVVHFKTDLSWLQKYIDRGHDLIALGGLVGSTSQDSCRDWIDRCFDLVCSTPNRLPQVKLHGFGITSYTLLLRYPWFSVDSTSWTKVGAFGSILVPHRRSGKFVFDQQPYTIAVSKDSPMTKDRGRHITTLSAAERRIVKDWLELIGIAYGSYDKDGTMIEKGVTSHHAPRRAANLLFFEMFRKSLPEYPWPFQSTRRKGLGLIC